MPTLEEIPGDHSQTPSTVKNVKQSCEDHGALMGSSESTSNGNITRGSQASTDISSDTRKNDPFTSEKQGPGERQAAETGSGADPANMTGEHLDVFADPVTQPSLFTACINDCGRIGPVLLLQRSVTKGSVLHQLFELKMTPVALKWLRHSFHGFC